MSPQYQLARLDMLPLELLHMLVDHSLYLDIKHMSCVNKRLREACLPYLFRNVRYEFSDLGLSRLWRLLLSDLCRHVVSFTYVVPELLKPGEHSTTLIHEIF